jgi:hypothetical protein
MFGYAIQHSVVSAEGQMNASMTPQPLKCNQGMLFLHFSNPVDEWWHKKHTWLIGHC